MHALYHRTLNSDLSCHGLQMDYQKLPVSYIGTYSGSTFVSKTLNEGCADLDQYPASKVRQLAKKLESSKATTCHIKQATSNPQAAQINLLRHQRTELAQKKKTKGHKRKQCFKPRDGKPPQKKLFRVLAQINLLLDCIEPFIHRFVSLPKACE